MYILANFKVVCHLVFSSHSHLLIPVQILQYLNIFCTDFLLKNDFHQFIMFDLIKSFFYNWWHRAISFSVFECITYISFSSQTLLLKHRSPYKIQIAHLLSLYQSLVLSCSSKSLVRALVCVALDLLCGSRYVMLYLTSWQWK